MGKWTQAALKSQRSAATTRKPANFIGRTQCPVLLVKPMPQVLHKPQPVPQARQAQP